MGKSARKSKKRKRSPSPDRLAGLEYKLSRLISVLTRFEVNPPRSSSPSPSVALTTPQQEAQGSHNESESDNHIGSDSGNILVSSARQTGPMDPRNLGVYETAGSVFAKYRRHDDTTFSVYLHLSIYFRRR